MAADAKETFGVTESFYGVNPRELTQVFQTCYTHVGDRTTVIWAANKRFEISKFRFKFPRARTYEMMGLVLGSIEAKICK